MRVAGLTFLVVCGLEAQTLQEPVTARQRLEWFAVSTAGPASLLGGLVSAGFGTWINQPHEYGPHWGGFADRYGMRFTGISTGNAIEASLGAVWGEDPRYPRAGDSAPFGRRVGRIIKYTFASRRADGDLHPAWARYAGIAGNNFLSNAWRESSEADASHAAVRIGTGVLGRMAGNAWGEFWPDVKRKVFHRE